MNKVLEIINKIKEYNSIQLSDDEERFIDYLLKINKVSMIQRYSIQDLIKEIESGENDDFDIDDLDFLEWGDELSELDEEDEEFETPEEYVQAAIDSILKKSTDKFGPGFTDRLKSLIDMGQNQKITNKLMEEAGNEYMQAEIKRLEDMGKLLNLSPNDVAKIETELSKQRFTDERNTRELQKHFYICACKYLEDKDFYKDKAYDDIIEVFNYELSPVAILAIKKRYKLTTDEVIMVVEKIGTDIDALLSLDNYYIAKKILKSDSELYEEE